MTPTKDYSPYTDWFVKHDEMGRLLGGRFISLTSDECIYEYDVSPKHLNPNGILHGGALYTVMDSSQGMLVHADLDPAFKAGATGTATIKYLAPVTSGTIRIHTKISRREGRKVFVESSAVDSNGVAVAHLDEIWIMIRV